MQGHSLRSSSAKLKRLQKEQARRCANNDHPILYRSGDNFFCVYCNALETDSDRVEEEKTFANMVKCQDEEQYEPACGDTSGNATHPSDGLSVAKTSSTPTTTGADLSASASHSRGVTIHWLLAWTRKHNCWSWPTSAVTKYIIQPATAHSHCRYTELPELLSPESTDAPELNGLGPSTSFVSHCWGAPFGDLVAALLDGGADPRRRVWIDIFAVRQWPGAQAWCCCCDMFRDIIVACLWLL